QHAGVNDATTQKALLDLITDHDLGRVWIICDGQISVGYAALIFSHSLEFAGRCGLLDEFFIQKEYRGKGIGKPVIELIWQAATKLGMREVFLEVSPGNHVAQKLYHSAGFESRPYDFLVRSTYKTGESV